MPLTMDTLITCIKSAFDDCELMSKQDIFEFEKPETRMRFELSKLKTFVLICGRKSVNDASLRCFLGKVEDTVRINTDKIHCELDDDATSLLVIDMIVKFSRDVESLEEEIDEWYVKVLDDYTLQSTTTSIAADEVLEVITCFLHNLLHLRSTTQWVDYIQMEQEISFLKSLFGFVSKRFVGQVEPLKEISAHSYSVTITLAHLFFRSIKHFMEEDLNGPPTPKYRQVPNDFHVYEIYTRVLSSSKLQKPLLASTQDLDDETKDFLDSLISDLWDLLRLNTYSCSSSSSISFNDDLKELYGELRSLRALVKHQHQLQQTKTKDDIGKVVCDAGVFICSLHQMTHIDDECLVLFQNLLNTLKSILMESGTEKQQVVDHDQFSNKAEEDIPVTAANTEEKEATTESYAQMIMPLQGNQGATSLANGSLVVGFHDDQTSIVDRLTRGSRKLQIVAIVGMPGLGKTTLATNVYTNPSILDYFTVRAWSPVSQVVNKNKVLLNLFNQIDPFKCSEMLVMPQPDFADGLRKSLKGRKYLIFLDDMWDIEAWYSLKASFPDDNVGSRIILTSRRYDVAPHDLMVNRTPHYLRQLNEEESLELFQKKLSSENGLPPPISLELGMKIAVKCRGLPLMIVIVAGVLKSIESDDWNAILDSIRNDNMHYRNTLELSYNHLPPHLRPCFLYFGAFKEDEEVSIRRLLQLWIAEGFVRKEAAERCLNDLIGRSLIMVAKQRSDGGVKSCRIHDLLHEFCIQKAKDEHLFHFLKGYDELSTFNEPHTLQRLCIQSEAVQDFTKSRLFCPQASSLIYYSSQSDLFKVKTYKMGYPWVDISSTIQISKLLTVLDLEQVELGYRFPGEINHLVHLAFLAIRCWVIEIPSLIGNLSNLETFILQNEDPCPTQFPTLLPDSLWNLQKLQYLYINKLFGATLPKNNLESSSTLDELDKFSGANIPYSMMKSLLGKIQNVRRLKCIISCKDDESQTHAIDQFSFEILKRLESLNLKVDYDLSYEFDLFRLPATLRKLTLTELKLSWRNLSTIGELPKLEVLKLLHVQLEGDTWEMKEGEFPQLRILTLRNPQLVKWLANCDDDEDQLGYFEKLVLDDCDNLEELPSCLDFIPTLGIIEVSQCYTKQVDLVKQIKKRREVNMGNSSLKIITSYTLEEED